jgi:hypothetical protein
MLLLPIKKFKSRFIVRNCLVKNAFGNGCYVCMPTNITAKNYICTLNYLTMFNQWLDMNYHAQKIVAPSNYGHFTQIGTYFIAIAGR